jgi:hypothetical protein
LIDEEAWMMGKRLNHEPPAVTAKLGWRYHHIGIPHTQPRAQEHHVALLGVHVSGFETSPYGIEWIRFEPHCGVPAIVRTVPHIAFAVDDLDEALKGREILIAPTEPSVGVRVAFILDDGAPIELLQFYAAKPVRPKARHAAEQRAALDDGTHKGMRRRK